MCTSCATIFTGTSDIIHFDSSPSGAMIYKDGLEVCRTPCSVPMKRSIQDVDIEMKLDGYETRLFRLDREFNVVSILNLGFLVGWAIDAVSGSLMKYDRKAYDLELTPNQKYGQLTPKTIEINTVKRTVDVYYVGE
ncbi:hypothetical protein GCM10025777_19960 [Membranihabitans marinus]